LPHLWAAASLPAQKRKLLDEGSARELESDIKEMCQGNANPRLLPFLRRGWVFLFFRFCNLD
jgi:hypothetical protein